MQIILPWPARELLPNFSGHWAKRGRAVRSARREAWALGLQTPQKEREEIAAKPEIVLSYEFTPPTGRGRPRDEDACMSALKAARDGLADSLNVNDSRFRNERPLWKPKEGAGKVVITIT